MFITHFDHIEAQDFMHASNHFFDDTHKLSLSFAQVNPPPIMYPINMLPSDIVVTFPNFGCPTMLLILQISGFSLYQFALMLVFKL